MMPSPPIHCHTGARHAARLSPGSDPACARPQIWPVVAPQILWSNPRSARSHQYPRPKLRAEATGSPVSAQLLHTLADAKSP